MNGLHGEHRGRVPWERSGRLLRHLACLEIGRQLRNHLHSRVNPGAQIHSGIVGGGT